MSLQIRMVFAITLLHLFAGTSEAFVSSLGVPNSFLEPVGWDVGDTGSTHQVWDVLTASTGNLPDHAYDTAGVVLSNPTLAAKPPGYGPTGNSNFYSFVGDFGAIANIYNHGIESSGLGTHVIVQIGSNLNPDQISFPGHGTGVYLDTLRIIDSSNGEITGGTNGDALQVSEVVYYESVFTSFGDVEYQEVIFEFWLPGYTGNFRIDWDQKVHASIDTVRVDTMIAVEASGGGSPFSLTTVGGESLVGDYNGDNMVDDADYALWKTQFGSAGPQADGNGDGIVNLADYTVWRDNLGASQIALVHSTTVPEPASVFVLSVGLAVGFCGWVRWYLRPDLVVEE